MDPILSHAVSKHEEIVTFIREMVECESPSGDAASMNRFVDLFAARTEDIAKLRTFPGGPFGRHFRCEFKLPGRKKTGQILALGHADTVWPVGTLKTMPFRRESGRLWGPGIFDMKSGLALFVFAMRALRDLDIPAADKVILQVNADEEVGSDSSRRLTEEIARQSRFVLVLEPAAGPDGKLKTARKGVGGYTVVVRGKAAHAGLDFTAGASAIVELAKQIERIAGFTRLERGITVNPGVISGGTRTNVIAAEARVDVDIRVVRMKDAGYLAKSFAHLKPFDKRCTIEVTGGLNRPPLERTAAVRKLFAHARRVATSMGISLGETSVGGGSDGNFTGAVGVPTLDGLGAVGEGAHAENESIVEDRIADRMALLAKLVADPYRG